MESGSTGYIYLGIPSRLAGVLWTTVNDMQRSLSGRENCAWAQLTSAALSRCVLHFACLCRERGIGESDSELACSEVFHVFAEQLANDTTAAEWSVPPHMVPVVAGTIAACGQLVVDRMGQPI
ncbi:hypothetical protein AWB77_05946 [Caballeronia fortuita]|uniref:Uncharacterized protein n=1 Tax=Caballeronia fortuita TaxID=1777138 RepID=A0A158DX67_9BURK|nr:hypothetical protein [Caballeronia fortuita]SAK99202.1 hypothetical protein AWB77_05946 [Caballeronia fortuita]